MVPKSYLSLYTWSTQQVTEAQHMHCFFINDQASSRKFRQINLKCIALVVGAVVLATDS